MEHKKLGKLLKEKRDKIILATKNRRKKTEGVLFLPVTPIYPGILMLI